MIRINLNSKLKIAEILIAGITVKKSDSAFIELNNCASRYFSQYKDSAISDVTNTKYARRLFRDIGIDPTKKRPSSEALLRRALKGLPLYKVNSLVDVGNFCSLDFLLPIGIYDYDKINFPIELRTGRQSESYIGIDDNELNLEGRYLLSDSIGAFGSPIKDSLRTSISLHTKNTLIVIFAPEIYDSEKLKENAKIMSERILEFCGGNVSDLQFY